MKKFFRKKRKFSLVAYFVDGKNFIIQYKLIYKKISVGKV